MDIMDLAKEIGKDAPWGLTAILLSLTVYRVCVPMAPVLAERWKLSATKKLNGSLTEQIRYAMGPFIARVKTLEDWTGRHDREAGADEERLTNVIADVRNLMERDAELREDIDNLRVEIHKNHVDLTKEIGEQANKTTKAISDTQRVILSEIQAAIRARQ